MFFFLLYLHLLLLLLSYSFPKTCLPLWFSIFQLLEMSISPRFNDAIDEL